MDSFLGMPMEQVVDSLGLSVDTRVALLRHDGVLGRLLRLTEALEMEESRMSEEEFIRVYAQEVGEMLNSAQGQALAGAVKVFNAA